MDDIPRLDLRPVGRGPAGAPLYHFRSAFPAWNIRRLKTGYVTARAAYRDARDYVRAYEAKDEKNNYGEALGVTFVDKRFYGVVNTYHYSG